MERPIRQETLIDRGVVRSRLPVEAAVFGRGHALHKLTEEAHPLQDGIAVTFRQRHRGLSAYKRLQNLEVSQFPIDLEMSCVLFCES
jgi:hypothetical protein